VLLAVSAHVQVVAIANVHLEEAESKKGQPQRSSDCAEHNKAGGASMVNRGKTSGALTS
jgi:hypothetical protein